MDSLQDILGSRSFEAPDEIKVVSDYVRRNYKSSSRVKLDGDRLILQVPSSGLAATLQLEQRKLIEACNLTKKLVIRYGR